MNNEEKILALLEKHTAILEALTSDMAEVKAKVAEVESRWPLELVRLPKNDTIESDVSSRE